MCSGVRGRTSVKVPLYKLYTIFSDVHFMREGIQMKKLNVTHAIYEDSEHNLKECKR